MRLSRRRFITIAACAAALPLGSSAAPAGLHEWRGVALGAPARLLLAGDDPAQTRRAVAACRQELARLEAIFSLYRPDSALVRLNRAGRLEAPPPDLVALMSQAATLSALSGGAFDVTVQPLWELWAGHFSRPDADPAGPPAERVAAARVLVDWRGVGISGQAITFDRPGMAVTLNGIAQGYVTDAVADLLRRQGFRDVVAAMGEIRALGRRPDGGKWQVGLPNGATLALDGAVATSSPDGTRFSPSAHHLFDPATGRGSVYAREISVTAPTATLADGASTALAVLPAGRAAELLRALPGVRVVEEGAIGGGG